MIQEFHHGILIQGYHRTYRFLLLIGRKEISQFPEFFLANYPYGLQIYNRYTALSFQNIFSIDKLKRSHKNLFPGHEG